MKEGERLIKTTTKKGGSHLHMLKVSNSERNVQEGSSHGSRSVGWFHLGYRKAPLLLCLKALPSKSCAHPELWEQRSGEIGFAWEWDKGRHEHYDGRNMSVGRGNEYSRTWQGHGLQREPEI